MFVSNVSGNYVLIKVKELSDHPVRISSYPDNDSKVMAKLRYNMPRSDGDDDCNN